MVVADAVSMVQKVDAEHCPISYQTCNWSSKYVV